MANADSADSRAYKTYRAQPLGGAGRLADPRRRVVLSGMAKPGAADRSVRLPRHALSLMYIWMVWEGRGGFEQSGLSTFFKLDYIGELYTNKSALNAELAPFPRSRPVRRRLDGSRRARALGMPSWLIFLCLPFTLMLGPVGVLVYIVLRLALFGFA